MNVNAVNMNPSLTTVGQGLFADASAAGGVQGTALPDPATRFALQTGVLSSIETLPMWGGVAIYENIPGASGAVRASLGPWVGRATSVTGGSYPIAGFSVFDQAYGMVTSPQSTVPLAGTFGQVMSYRLGSGARIWVACDPGLASLEGGAISQAFAWDFENQQLIPYVSTVNVSSGTYDADTTISSATYNAVTGLVTLTLAAASHLSPGNTFTISAATGTGAYATLNGTWTAGAGTSGATVTFTAPVSLTLTLTGGTFSSGLVVLTIATSEPLDPGDSVIVSGLTGSGSFAAANGTFTAAAGTGLTKVAYQVAGGLTMTISTTGTVSTGAAALPVSVLGFEIGNSMTVNYNATANTGAWNFTGSCALIQI